MVSVNWLRKKYFQNTPPWEADTLLQFSTGKTKEYILTHPEHCLSIWQMLRFYFTLFKFRHGYPLAYITHHKEFYGLDFYVDPRVLVPRPDTELIVDEAIKILNSKSSDLLIDLGTGSGCIPIAIIKSLKQKFFTIATDASSDAIKVAEMNANNHGVKIEFRAGDLMEPVLSDIKNFGDIVITANLPYGWDEWKSTESIKHEPKAALFTGKNGLELYEELLHQLKTISKPFTALFEFDPRQTEALTKLIKQILPSAGVEIKKDLAGRDRLAIISSQPR